jgi:hypothetical protein
MPSRSTFARGFSDKIALAGKRDGRSTDAPANVAAVAPRNVLRVDFELGMVTPAWIQKDNFGFGILTVALLAYLILVE